MMRFILFLLTVLALFGCGGNTILPTPSPLAFDRDLVFQPDKLTFLYFSTPR
jgi:hypothetical protein